MIKDRLEKAINDQINAELYSAYLYASMEQYFYSINLKGFANWMHVQTQEEMAHAIRFANYVNGRGGRVLLKAIDAPPSQWDNPLQVFEEIYKHEQKVTSLINGLVDLAMEEKDHAMYNMLQWFVAEQVEEESSADDIVQQLKLIHEDKSALFMIDRELAARVFTDPNATNA